MTTLFNPTTVTPDNYDHVDDIEGQDFVTQLVGEGKKFRDMNALAKGKMQSDLFIQSILAEKRDLEAKLNSTQSVEDLIKSLKNDQTSPNPGGERRTEVTGTNPEDIQRIVQETVAAREDEARKNRNLAEVTETLKAKLGSNYATELENRVADLGVGKAFLDDLAKTNPKAFLKLVGIETKTETSPSVFSPPSSRINTGATVPSGTGEKTYSYYEKLRKSDPSTYRSLQSEMFAQAVKLGDDFYK